MLIILTLDTYTRQAPWHLIFAKSFCHNPPSLDRAAGQVCRELGPIFIYQSISIIFSLQHRHNQRKTRNYGAPFENPASIRLCSIVVFTLYMKSWRSCPVPLSPQFSEFVPPLSCIFIAFLASGIKHVPQQVKFYRLYTWLITRPIQFREQQAI